MPSQKKPDPILTVLQSISARIGETNERLEQFERKQSESSTRLIAELMALATAVNGMRSLIGELQHDQQRFSSLEERILIVERKIGS